MSIKIKRLTETAKIPTKGSEYAAGFDLYADSFGNFKSEKEWSLMILPGETVKINTGVAVALPENTWGGIYARSGLATKQGLAPANKVGVIDSDYRGPLIVALYNQSGYTQMLHQGDRVAQLVIHEFKPYDFEEVDELDDTDRGEGGFGSTGSN